MSTKSLRQTIEVLTRTATDLGARLDQAEMDLDVERGAVHRMSQALAEISVAIHGEPKGVNPERHWREILPAVRGMVEEQSRLQTLNTTQYNEIVALKCANEKLRLAYMETQGRWPGGPVHGKSQRATTKRRAKR